MIIFYHEFNSVSSGAAVLIVNLAKGLIKAGEKVLLINLENGAFNKEFYDLDRSMLTVIDKNRSSIQNISTYISPSDTIFTTHFYSVYKHFKKANPKIFFIALKMILPYLKQIVFLKELTF